MVQFMQASPDGGASTTYLSLAAVMSVLVFLSMWRELSSGDGRQFFPRMFAATAFVASRAVVVIFAGALVVTTTEPPLLYIVLNFLALYLAAGSVLGRSTDDAMMMVAGPGGTGETDQRYTLDRSYRFQAAVYALLGALVYVVMPKPEMLGFSVSGFVTAAVAGATFRVIVHLFASIRYAAKPLQGLLVALVFFLTASWLLVIGASINEGADAAFMIRASRVADILALMCALLAIQSNYLLMGFYHRNRADSKEEEAEKAKKELDLLSRVASDIYEDSSSMIQRQQDRSRDLMRRVESLEKILQIGITIQKRENLKDLLEMIAGLVRENLGFNTVILRILNERTQSFETKAFVGLSEEAQDAVVNYRLPRSEFERMVDPRFRISKSYFVKRAKFREETEQGTDEGTVLLINQWADVERLIVPLVDEGEKTIGYLSVEDPINANTSVVDAIDNLEMVATLAVIAIRNARFTRDVAEKNEKLKIYAEKLSGLNKMKSNFVATISHEFRTPLTSIKAYCETLIKNADSVDRNILKEFLYVIDEESNRLMALIEDILDFSQMESGAIKFERTSCNLNELIDVSTGELAKNFERKHISLHREVPSKPVLVRAERDLMKQLLVNLLHNASKFTRENGEVWVRLEDETVSARVTVEDNGVGIPEDQIDKIFDGFHQADGTNTREFSGSGLGLAICKNIVDWHDGKIWVENKPEAGSKFVVVIPKKQAIVRSHVVSSDATMRRYEIERYLESMMDVVTELMDVKKASIMLLDEETQELRIEAAVGLDEEIVESARVKIGEGIAGKIAQEGQSLLVKDINRDARVSAVNNDLLYDSRSCLCVAIKSNDKTIGVVNVANPDRKETFDQIDCGLLEFFADRMGQALKKMRGFATASREFEDVRNAFKSILDAKRCVSDQSGDALKIVLTDTAERLGLTREETAILLYSFNVYDLGLTKIGYSILKQPRPLPVSDRKSVEQHTIVGTEMLEAVEVGPQVRDAVLYHHENYDGTGYPAKLAGEEIPVLARVIRVVDSFRALISHRTYQKQYSVEEAIEVLKHRSGTLFDPRIVSVFVEAVGKRRDLFRSARSPERADGVECVATSGRTASPQGGN